MSRLSPQLRALVSCGLLASYLAAAFLDCEPIRPAIGTGHAAPMAQAEPAANETGHSHGEDHASGDRTAGEHAHGASHAGDHADETTVAARQGVAELKPTCGCGCGESRSRIGGNVSRLGSVIPGVEVARLSELIPVHRAMEREFSPPNVFLEIDPVPI